MVRRGSDQGAFYSALGCVALAAKIQDDILARLTNISSFTTRIMTTWIEENIDPLEHLVLHASGTDIYPTADLLQHDIDLIRDADKDYLRIGVCDRNGITVAVSPPQDESGRSTIGAERLHRAILLLEKSAKDGLIDALPACLSQAERDYAELLQALDRERS